MALRARIETPEVWRNLRADFRGVPNRDGLHAATDFGPVGGDASSHAQFKALAKRGGLALGAAQDEALKAWLTAVAEYLKRARRPWLHRTQVQPGALIAIGNDDYAWRDPDG